VLARDDRAVDVGVGSRRHQFFLGRVLGGTADGERGAQGEIKLANVEALIAVHVPEDYAER
jgi:hypothetical protein